MKPIRGLLLALLSFGLWLAACDGLASSSNTSVLPPPTLSQDVQQDANAIEANQTAQEEYYNYLQLQKTAEASRIRVTEAAMQAQQAAAQLTASANATREALASQATRQALNEQATERAQNVAATATVQMIQATKTAVSERATQTAQSIQALQTVEESQAAATERARNTNATETAQTQDAASTATIQAQSAQATQAAASATATVISAQVLAAQEKADWDRKLEAGRAVGLFVVGGLALIGLLLLVGWAALRFIDAGVLRFRIFRDRTGVPFLILETDREGRQTMISPTRSPGAVVTVTPPSVRPLQIGAHASDPDTTKRDQAVSLMLAAGQGSAQSAARELADAIGEEQIRMIEAPTLQMLPAEVQMAIDADWKVVSDA